MTNPAFVSTVRYMTDSTRDNHRSLAALEARISDLEQGMVRLLQVFSVPDMLAAHAQVHKTLIALTADTLTNVAVIQKRGFGIIERANQMPAGPPKDPMEKMMEYGQIMLATASALQEGEGAGVG